MVKLSDSLSAGGAVSYHKSEFASNAQRYYTADEGANGRWFGRAAAALGLVGPVKEEHFLELAYGRHPFTGEQLVAHRKYAQKEGKTEHRAAIDINIAPPKSVTAAALVGGDRRVVRAHEQAAEVSLHALETCVQARLSRNRVLTTENFAVALFQHDTARPVGDEPPAPQMHIHAVMFNLTKDGERYRSLDPRELYRVQSWATAIYRAELTSRLHALGYQTERTSTAFEIVGYTSEYLKAISPRSDEIDAEMEKRGLKGAATANKVALSTRAPKQIWEREALLAEHQKQAEQYGNQPQKVRESATAVRVETPEARQTASRAGVSYARERLSERNAVFDRYEVERDALRHGLGKVLYADVQVEVKERRETDLLPVFHYRRYAPGERYTTPEAVAMETAILERERDGRARLRPIAEGLTKADVRQEEHLNDPQKWLVWNISQSKNRILGVQGGAGTGKTFGLDAIRKIIENHAYETRGLAPTSSAAKELQKAGMGSTVTIQKFLQRPEAAPSLPCVYFVDESSLAATVQMDGLLKRLRQQDRLVLVGDVRQHQSVEAGRIFEEMIEAGMETFRLEKIVRQADPHLKAIVQKFAAHDPLAAVALLTESESIHTMPNEKERHRAIAEKFLSDPANTLIVSPDNESRQLLNAAVRDALQRAGLLAPNTYAMTILVARQNLTKEDLRHAFSYHAGDHLRFARRNPTVGIAARDRGKILLVNHGANLVTFEHEDGRILTFNPRTLSGVNVFESRERHFAVGDRIQFTAPISERRIANRDLAVIEKLDDHGNARLRLDDGSAINLNLNRYPHIDHGYALTTYSAQGKTADHLLMHAPVQDSRYRHMVDEAFGYVGLSRPRYSVHVYTDDQNALQEAFQHRNLKPKALCREQIKDYQTTHEMIA